MDSELLKQAIEDAKAVKMLVLSWNEGQFWGVMGWDDAMKGTVKRVSCHCGYCNKQMPLEASASHASACTTPQKEGFDAVYVGKPVSEEDIDAIIKELDGGVIIS